MMRAVASRGRNPIAPSSSGHSISRRRGTSSTDKGTAFTIIWTGLLIAVVLFVGVSLYGLRYVTTKAPLTPSAPAPSTPAAPTKSLRTASGADAKAVLAKLKQDFESRYGSYSMTLLQRGLDEYGSIETTAARMAEASQAGRPFVMAFSGYSVTVGRGNYFNQSFPFEVQRILSEPMQKLLGIPLVVRNAAIGGIPSFPYSFCLEHFVGSDPDVLSWDYSMNEGSSESSMEAFLRQSMQQLPKRPMIIMLDKNVRRTKLLKTYAEQGLIADAIAVGRKDNVLDTNTLDSLKPLPPGFQHWDEFGAPPSCPGRGLWHPKRQEHSMIGWIIAMHFVKVMERAYEMIQQPSSQVGRGLDQMKARKTFPAALSRIPDNDAEVNELLFGHKVEGKGQDSYVMKDLSCRTSFVPATDETKTLPSIVVSGFADADLDIMLDRTEEHYRHGWVMDVSKIERDTKRKVEHCGGLGYVDMKIALYGIPASGKLRLWLPFEGPAHDDHSHAADDVDAKHWFDDLIFCEANEKRQDDACKLYEDLSITVGGVDVSSIREVSGAAEYLKRKTCVNVGIPTGAKITKLGDVTTVDGKPLSREDKQRLGGGDDGRVGVVVDVNAKPKVTLNGGACCLSHIVWEMH